MHNHGTTTMKGCLKLPTPVSTPTVCPHRKCVAFGSDGSESPTEEYFPADDWDRTPTEPYFKLTYQDILELKEIQRSLPRANQLPDPFSKRQTSHYLSRVPIGLLPLLPDTPPPSGTLTPTTTPNDSPSETPTTPSPIPSHTPPPIPTSCSINPNTTAPLTPPSWNAVRPTPIRPRPSFSFLPLLETPTPDKSPCADSDAEDHDPPTPALTNASSGGSPVSRSSSVSPDPSFLSLSMRSLDPSHRDLVGGRSHTELRTNEVDESYFPSYAPSTPKPPTPTTPTATPAPGFEELGFVLNGDVDGDYDSTRRSMHQSHTAPRPPSNRLSQSTIKRSFNQPKINRCPSWAKCAPPPPSSGVLFKRPSWGNLNQSQVAVKPVHTGRNVPWSG